MFVFLNGQLLVCVSCSLDELVDTLGENEIVVAEASNGVRVNNDLK